METRNFPHVEDCVALGDVGDLPRPDPVGRADRELPPKQVGRDWQECLEVGRRHELALGA